MATESVLKIDRNNLKVLHSKREMMQLKFKEYPTIENRDAFFDAEEVFNDNLNKYYADFLMWLKSTKNDLFDTWLYLPRETVKRNLLTELINQWKN